MSKPRVPRPRQGSHSAKSNSANIAAVKSFAGEFGELTQASLERLGPDNGTTSEIRAARRREHLERVAGKQALLLFEAMAGLLPTAYRQTEDVRGILAQSFGIGLGFALLPNRQDADPDALNEESALEALGQDPAAWLEFSEDERRFRYTPGALEQLRRSYVAGSGCPLVSLEIAGEGEAESFNLFVAYWGLLASEHQPRGQAV